MIVFVALLPRGAGGGCVSQRSTAAALRRAPGPAVDLDGSAYDKMALWEMATGPLPGLVR